MNSNQTFIRLYLVLIENFDLNKSSNAIFYSITISFNGTFWSNISISPINSINMQLDAIKINCNVKCY